MSIISAVQTFLETCPTINLVHIDRPDQKPSNYAVALAGNSKISEDVLGNKTYQYSFTFFVREYTGSDVERLDNHDFLQDFSDWIEEQDEIGNYPTLPTNCEAESMSVANMLLFDVDEDGSEGLYQVQLNLIYTKGRT
jgi:hypothetical protein